MTPRERAEKCAAESGAGQIWTKAIEGYDKAVDVVERAIIAAVEEERAAQKALLFRILDVIALQEGTVFDGYWTMYGISEADRETILKEWNASDHIPQLHFTLDAK